MSAKNQKKNGSRIPRRAGRSERLAAIDLGTNSFHLVIAEPRRGGKFRIIGSDKEVVRLGTGKTDMKLLGREAIERALRTLERFRKTAAIHGARIRAVATSAVREASNRGDFVRLVRERLGIEVEVVSGFEEALLIYLGTLQALPVYRRKVLVVDIGGGSTEFILGLSGKPVYINSLKLGAIRLTERFFPDGVIRSKAIGECRRFLAGELYPVRRALSSHGVEVHVGTSGTIQNLCAMHLKRHGREIPFLMNNITITRRDLDETVEMLLRMKRPEDRVGLPGLDPARADIIPAGALLLERIFDELGIARMTYSGYALREGILFDTISTTAGAGRSRLSNLRRESILHVGELFNYNRKHARKVSTLAGVLFDETKKLHALDDRYKEYLEAAALLHDVGYHIAHAQHHRHTYYLIRNAEVLGYTEREIEIIANTARYHRKSHPKQKHEGFARLSDPDREIVRRLAAILRIADGLDRTYKDVVSYISCRRRRDTLTIELTVKDGRDPSLEIWGAERRKGLLEELYNIQVKFSVRTDENLHGLQDRKS